MLIDNGTKLRVLQFDNIYNRSFTILDNFTSVQILNQVSCVDFTKFAVRHGVALFRRLCDLQRCKQSEMITRGIISSIEQIRVPDWWCCLHDSAVASCDNDVKCVTLIVRCSLDMLYESWSLRVSSNFRVSLKFTSSKNVVFFNLFVRDGGGR
jgi:hypothetical protein